MKEIRTAVSGSLLAAGLALGPGAALAQQSQPGSPSQSQGAGQQSAAQGSQSGGSGSLERVVQQHSNLSTFVRALEETGLADSLTGGTQYTVFAPTNQAFDSMEQSVDQLLAPANREQLIAMLRAHIVADDVDPARARELDQALTLDGDTISLEERDGSLMIGDANVVESNLQQGNLRIYAIDQVLDRGESQVATSGQGERPRG